MAVETYVYDSAEMLDTPEAQAAYLRITIEEEDAAHLAEAIGVVARARGMTAIAESAGISRESLYKALREEGSPGTATIMKVLEALGVTLTAATRGTSRAATASRRKRPASKQAAA